MASTFVQDFEVGGISCVSCGLDFYEWDWENRSERGSMGYLRHSAETPASPSFSILSSFFLPNYQFSNDLTVITAEQLLHFCNVLFFLTSGYVLLRAHHDLCALNTRTYSTHPSYLTSDNH